MENAENQLSDLKKEGYTEAFILTRGQRFFVCYGKYATIEEAQTVLEQVKVKSNDKAWILTK